MNIEKSWQLNNSISAYNEFNRNFNEYLEEHSVDAAGNYALNVAVEELITNIIKFNSESKEVEIVVNLVISAEMLEICVTDNAGAFDINLAKKPDLTRDIQDIEIGGLGLDLVKNLFDSCEYKYAKNNNMVKLTYKVKQ